MTSEERLFAKCMKIANRIQDPYDMCAFKTLIHCAKVSNAAPGKSTLERVDRVASGMSGKDRRRYKRLLAMADRGF